MSDSPIHLLPNSVLYQDFQHSCSWCNHLIRIIYPQSQLAVFTTSGFEGRHRPLQTPPSLWRAGGEQEAWLSLKLVPRVFSVGTSSWSMGCPLGQAALVVLSVWWYQNHLRGLLKCKFLDSNPDLKMRILGGMSQAFVF